MKNKKIKGFTLVELIIVITILSILALIVFISFKSYGGNARDGSRIATLKNVETGLSLYQVKTWNYPIPEWDIKEGLIQWVLYIINWEIWPNISKQIQLNTIPKDPKIQTNYVYARSEDAQEYQLATVFESPFGYRPLFLQTQASWYQVKVEWNYKWFVKYQSGNLLEWWCVSYVNIPSIIWSNTGSVNLLLTGAMQDTPIYVVNKGENLPYWFLQESLKILPDQVVKIMRNDPDSAFTTICKEELENISNKQENLDNNEKQILTNFWVKDQLVLKEKILWDKTPIKNSKNENLPIICDEWYEWENCVPKSIQIDSVVYNNITWSFPSISLLFGTPITKTWLYHSIAWGKKELTLTLTLLSDGQTITYSNIDEIISCNAWFTQVWTDCKRNIVAYDGGKRWSDESYATNCNGYKNPSGNYTYAGAVWDWIYFIKPDTNPAFKVYCDMTRDDGWWTLVVRATTGNYNHRNINAVGSFSALGQTSTFKFSDSLINTIPKTIYRANNDNFSASIYFDTSDTFASTRQVSNKVKPTYWGTIWYGPYKNNMHLWFNTIDNTPTNYWWQLTWVEWFAYTGVSGDECRRWFAIKWVNGWYCPIGNWENWYIFLK